MMLSHGVHVLGKREELDSVRLQGKVAIVLDILFATSTMVAALANGATGVIPVIDGAAASAEAARHAPGSFVLAGELDAITLPGFAAPMPLALIAQGVGGRKLILSTTNGTGALHDCAAADHVYAGSLLNGRALIEYVLAAHPGQALLIVCAGSANNFNLEDFYGAGYLVELLAERLGGQTDFSDSARAARSVYRHGAPAVTLLEARVGRMMIARAATEEVRFAAQLSVYDVVPRFLDGRLAAA